MANIAVIFDTNSCHVDRTKQSFFGQHTILEEIAARATIIMPQIVIDELVQQNLEGTAENIKNLKSNPLLEALGFDAKKLEEIIDHEHVESLIEAENIKYQTIDIHDKVKAFEKIRTWVVPGEPPFNQRKSDGKNNSDKGLKDAIVACTIDELLAENEYDAYFLATGDGRLKDYYVTNRKITCLLPKEILDELEREFFDEYTIDVIRNEIGSKSAVLKDSWLNINSDTVALFENDEYLTLVVLDSSSKEIVKSTDAVFVISSDNLVASGGYAATHDIVSEIKDYLDYYKEDQLSKIKDGLMNNDQVYGIGTDEDVKTLASAIYNFFLPQLSEDERRRFDVYYNLKELS